MCMIAVLTSGVSKVLTGNISYGPGIGVLPASQQRRQTRVQGVQVEKLSPAVVSGKCDVARFAGQNLADYSKASPCAFLEG